MTIATGKLVEKKIRTFHFAASAGDGAVAFWQHKGNYKGETPGEAFDKFLCAIAIPGEATKKLNLDKFNITMTDFEFEQKARPVELDSSTGKPVKGGTL